MGNKHSKNQFMDSESENIFKLPKRNDLKHEKIDLSDFNWNYSDSINHWEIFPKEIVICIFKFVIIKHNF